MSEYISSALAYLAACLDDQIELEKFMFIHLSSNFVSNLEEMR